MHKRIFLVFFSALISITSVAQHKKKISDDFQKDSTGYYYKIGNGTDRDINFYISIDSTHWEQVNIEPSFQSVLHYTQETIYFRMPTSMKSSVAYKISGNTTYKIYFNPDIKKFDLLISEPCYNCK